MSKKLPELVPATAYQELRMNLVASSELGLLQGWYKGKAVLHLISVQRNKAGEVEAILPLSLMYDEKDLDDIILPDMIQQKGDENVSPAS